MYEGRLRTTRNQADVRRGDRHWFRFDAKAGGDTAAVYIYDEISWFGITAQQFIDELRGVTAKTIALHINSPGGDVFDGIAIYNALRQHSATVNVTVDGLAASIASVIAMAGDRVEMARGGMFMIHEPFAMTIGDAADHRKNAEALDKMAVTIAGIYAARAGGSVDYWRGLMAEETWFTDEESVTAKLADVLATAPAATNAFDLSVFRNAPRGELAAARAVDDGRREGGVNGTRDVGEGWRREARLKVVAAVEEMLSA